LYSLNCFTIADCHFQLPRISMLTASESILLLRSALRTMTSILHLWMTLPL
jgi:hypothetical protein